MNPKPVSVRDKVDELSIKLPIKIVLPLEKEIKFQVLIQHIVMTLQKPDQ